MIFIQSNTYGAIITVDCVPHRRFEPTLRSRGIWFYTNFYADGTDYVGRKVKFT